MAINGSVGHGGMSKKQWWDASRFFREGGVAEDFKRCTTITEALDLFEKRNGYRPAKQSMMDMLELAGIALAERRRQPAVASEPTMKEKFEKMWEFYQELSR